MIPIQLTFAFRSLLVFLVCSSFWFCTEQLSSAPVIEGGRIAKPVCLMQQNGCPCYKDQTKKETVTMLYHNEALIEIKPTGTDNQATSPNLTIVARYNGNPPEAKDQVCYYPTAQLRWQPTVSDQILNVQKLDHSPLTLDILFKGLSKGLTKESAKKEIDSYRKVTLRKVWFTYYHLALEEHHPGPKVPVLSPQGKVIGHTSKEFQNQVRWQGSGIADDGKKYHYAGIQGRYHLYNEDWGMGAGRGFEVFPYRTIAVNFHGFCSKLYPNDAAKYQACRKGGVLGTAVYFPEIAQAKVKMEDGSVHDGWFCATDTGAATHIKEDRIDIFVGTHGGGNPYLPASRQWNTLYAAGFKNSVQWDWRLWRTETQRIWCDFDKVPKDGESPDPARHCLHDYHGTTPEKALTMQVAYDKAGELLRCRTGKEIRELRGK